MHPAVAIVDTRNVRGASERVLGHSFRPTVNGVKAAMAMHGFDVQEVVMSVAFARGRHGGGGLWRAHDENKQFAAAVAGAGGLVLPGLLQPDGPGFKEKQCDVLLALEIQRWAIRFRGDVTIVLLSSDTDLQPAVSAAQKYGARVVVAGEDGVVNWPTYASNCGWIKLGDAALAAIAEVAAGRKVGHRLRQAVASLPWGAEEAWTVLKEPAVGRNGRLCQSPSEALGVAPLGPEAIGTTVQLVACGLDWGKKDDARFPVARLHRPGFIAANACEMKVGQVVSWTNTLRLIVEVDTVRTTLNSPVGYLTREVPVMVHLGRTRDGRPFRRLVGATETPAFVRDVTLARARAVHLATISRWTADTATATLSDGSEVRVKGLNIRTATAGARFACVLEGTDTARAISSALS